MPNASTAARTAFGRKPPGEMIVIVLVLALGIAAIIFGANAEAGGI